MNWQEVKTTDVLDGITTGKKDVNQASETGAYPFFSCARENRFFSDDPILDKDAILIAGNGAYTGYVKKHQGPFDLYQRTYALYDFKDGIDWRYIYFIFKHYFEKRYMGGTTGAAIPYITKPIITEFSFRIPADFAMQEKIADILCRYDDLIQNNQRRITLLEKSVRLLYREWFECFRYPGNEREKTNSIVPRGWKQIPLGDFADIKKGRNITKETTSAGDVPVVAGGLESAYYHNEANVRGPVITVSASGANAGYVNLYFSDIWASDCSYISVSDYPDDIWFLYCTMKEKQVIITGMQQGAAQPHVYPKHLMKLEIVLPPEETRMKFHTHADPIFRKIGNLTRQNLKLTEARDLLLPRLMDGRIAL